MPREYAPRAQVVGLREISDEPIEVGKAQEIDTRGRMLVPGLIDAHIHRFIAMCIGQGKRPVKSIERHAPFACQALKCHARV